MTQSRNNLGSPYLSKMPKTDTYKVSPRPFVLANIFAMHWETYRQCIGKNIGKQVYTLLSMLTKVPMFQIFAPKPSMSVTFTQLR